MTRATGPLGIIAMIAAFVSTPAWASEVDGVVPTHGIYLQMIQQARADGRPRAAIAYLDDFDRRFPTDLDARVLRINSLLDLGQVDAAETLISALGKAPTDHSKAAAMEAVRGHVFAARGQWEQAILCYQAAVSDNPTESLFRNALGYALLRAHRPDAAIEMLRAAADLTPDDTIVRNNLALAYALAGKTAALTGALARSGDLQSQATLKAQILAEVTRIAAVDSPPQTGTIALTTPPASSIPLKER